ncbi:MAG: hypothetical protein ACJ763_00990 [Bdellovibrionia bacterium]
MQNLAMTKSPLPDQTLYGLAMIPREDWNSIKERFKKLQATSWETDIGNETLRSLIYCPNDEVDEYTALLLKVDPSFEMKSYTPGASEHRNMAVIEIHAIPPTYKQTSYFAPSVWQLLQPELETLKITFDHSENPTQVTVNFHPKDRAQISQLSKEAEKQLKASRKKQSVFIVMFTIEERGLDGQCAVGAKTAKEAKELFLKNIHSLDSELENIDLSEIEINEVLTLADYEKEIGDTIPREKLPKDQKVTLLDLGS